MIDLDALKKQAEWNILHKLCIFHASVVLHVGGKALKSLALKLMEDLRHEEDFDLALREDAN